MAGTGGRILSKSLLFLPSLSLRRNYSAAVAGILTPNPSPPSPSAHFSVAEYLVQSCGLSKKDAEAASPALAHLRSPDRPDAVLRFLAERGLAGDEIAALVSRRPHLLSTTEKSNLPGKFDFLVSLGFSAAEVAVLLQKTSLLNERSLSSVKKRVDFLRSILEEDAAVAMKLIKKSPWMLTGGMGIERKMMDNITKLRKWGVSNERIKALITGHPRIFLLNSEIIDDSAAVAEGEFGISRNARIFVYAVAVLSVVQKPARQSRYEVFESFGWKKSDIVALFRTFPTSLGHGVAHLTKHLEFLMNKAGYTPSCFVKCGSMLGMSLERRVIPRYELFCALKANEISCKAMRMSFYYFVCVSEKDFHRRFVNEFMELEPDACKLYMSRCKSVRELEHH